MPFDADKNSDDRRAVHELGHALIDIAYGWPVISISIDDGAVGGGSVKDRYPGPDLKPNIHPVYRELAEMILVAQAAGAAAEYVIFGESFGDGGDYQVHQQFVELYRDKVGEMTLKNADWLTAVAAGSAILHTYQSYHKVFDALVPLLVKERQMEGIDLLDHFVRLQKHYIVQVLPQQGDGGSLFEGS